MSEQKKAKLIRMFILLGIAWIVLGLLFNSWMFHKEGTPGEKGHSEPRVYITRYGDCYHKSTCSYIKEKYEIGLYEARELGYVACSHCKGYSSGTVWVEGTEGEPDKNNYIGALFVSFCVLVIPGFFWYLKIIDMED